MKDLEKVRMCRDVSLVNKTKFFHTVVFSITMYGYVMTRHPRAMTGI